MAALTRRTMLAGLAAAAALRPERAFAAWPERNISLIHGLTAGRRRRCQRAGDRRRPVAEARPADRGRTEARRRRHAGRRADGARHARRLSAAVDPERLCRLRGILQVAAYRPIDDFTIIGQAIEFPFMIVTYPDHTIRNIPDLIKTAKSRSEPLLCGVPGAGTPQHLLIEYFMRLAGIKIQVVPFRGGNQALTDLLGKRHRLPDRSADRADRPDQVRRACMPSASPATSAMRRCRMSAPSPRQASPDSPSRRGWACVGPAKLPPDITVAAQQGDQRADRRACRGGEHSQARQRAQGRHAGRFQGAHRQGHRALDQGDRRRGH